MNQLPSMDDNGSPEPFEAEDFADLRKAKQVEGANRRVLAQEMYPQAAQFVKDHGFCSYGIS